MLGYISTFLLHKILITMQIHTSSDVIFMDLFIDHCIWKSSPVVLFCFFEYTLFFLVHACVFSLTSGILAQQSNSTNWPIVQCFSLQRSRWRANTIERPRISRSHYKTTTTRSGQNPPVSASSVAAPPPPPPSRAHSPLLVAAAELERALQDGTFRSPPVPPLRDPIQFLLSSPASSI